MNGSMGYASLPAMLELSPSPSTAATVRPAASARPQHLVSEVSDGGLIGVLLSATVLAALIAGGINLWLAGRRSREEERARVRNTCAEAYRAYAEYKEFPYAIRRRDATRPAEERLRLSEALREVQARLSYYQTWTTLEATAVGEAYDHLIRQVRIVAGGAMQRAWNESGLERDAQMNIAPDLVDLAPLEPFEQAYRVAVAQHLRLLAPRWPPHRRSARPTASGARDNGA